MTPAISLTAGFTRCVSLLGLVPRQERMSRARGVPSPSEPLVAGRAEAVDQQIQKLFRDGRRQVTVDLSGVSTIDDAGIRALVRGAAAARRVGGLLRLAAVRPAVARALESSDVSSAFEIHDSVASARIASWPWRAVRLTAEGLAVCGALVWAGFLWPVELAGVRDAAEILAPGQPSNVVWFQPFVELLKLVAAALVGLLITAIHQPNTRDYRSSMGQAQTLLCVSGAVMMIIIGNSLARAFGIAGAASIIRFRTPVDDPKDVTVLFLLMGLGMSIGLGAFAVAGLGAAFLCIALIVLGRTSIDTLRVMSVEFSANGPQFPTAHVEGVFARHRIAFEPREILTAENGVKNHKYQAWLDSRTSLEELNAELMTNDAGLTAVAWAHAKRERP
jgi:anti-anti-sigma factor